MTQTKSSVTAYKWIIVSAVGFLLFIGATVVFGMYSARLNLINSSLYFFLLIPLALVAAGFLFGALRSYAKYNGKAYGGTLQLGGPVIVLIAVILLGFKFRPQEKEVNYTINFFDSADTTQAIQQGKAVLYFGAARVEKNIDDGQATFNELPYSLIGKEITLLASSAGYESGRMSLNVANGHTVQNVFLTKTRDSVSVHGLVNNKSNDPISNATLVFADGLQKTTSDVFGNFSLTLPLKEGDEVPLRIYINHQLRFDNLVVLSGKVSLKIQLP